MRIYIIGRDGITLCRKAPATPNDGEIAVASNEELHAAPLSAKRLLALRNALPGVEKRKKLGDRHTLIDQLWSAIELLPVPEPQPDPKRPSKQDVVIASYGSRCLLGNLEEKARAHSCLGPRGAWPGLSHRRAGERMKSPAHEASARQHSGEPFSGLSANDARRDGPAPDRPGPCGLIARA
jgi:hypothetical protein